MRSLVLMALTITPLTAAPTLAQSRSSPFTIPGRDPPFDVGSGRLSFRINDVVRPDGAQSKRRSIIAGVEVGPDTFIGVGLFDSMPKARGHGPDPRLDGLTKRSRKAAVGMTLRF